MDVASLNRMAQRASRRRASCAGGGHPAAVASTTTAATVFHDFLVKTFPAETQAGSTIVDVAGGQGDLAWLLCNANKCNAAVLDPLGSGEGRQARRLSLCTENRILLATLIVTNKVSLTCSTSSTSRTSKSVVQKVRMVECTQPCTPRSPPPLLH